MKLKNLTAKLSVEDKKSVVGVFIQFIKFGIVGLSNTIIFLAVYYIFIYINDSLYLLGNLIGWLLSVVNAFFWSRKFVFKDSGESAVKALLKSYVSYGASFLLASALLFVQVEWLSVSETLAPLFNLLITIPLNFVVNKYWTFK